MRVGSISFPQYHGKVHSPNGRVSLTILTVRLPRVDVADAPLPEDWLGGDPFRSQLLNALSMMFPAGEQFFMEAARAALPMVEDADRREEIRRFIAQEATHSHLHRQMNARLAAQGLRNWVEPVILWRIRLSRRFGVLDNLAIGMAYEHFTAAFGTMVLRHPEWLADAPDPWRVLWTWHAVEECEHRAVLFDLYRMLGGGYGRRVLWFIYAGLVLLTDLTVQTLANLWRRRSFRHAATWRSAGRWLFGRGGVAGATLPCWISYFKPGFRPDPAGEEALAREWLDAHRPWFTP